MNGISVACLDMAGTTVADDGVVMAAFDTALVSSGLGEGAPGHDDAITVVRETMGQSKIEVFRLILGDEGAAQTANAAFERHYANAVLAGAITPLPGAAATIEALTDAGIKVCLATGFSRQTRDSVIDLLGWGELIDLALSPSDVGRGRPWPDLPLTALIRLGGGAVSELVVVGDTASDVESGRRAGAGIVAGVLTGAGTRDELERSGATHVIGSIAGLLPVLGLAAEPAGQLSARAQARE